MTIKVLNIRWGPACCIVVRQHVCAPAKSVMQTSVHDIMMVNAKVRSLTWLYTRPPDSLVPAPVPSVTYWPTAALSPPAPLAKVTSLERFCPSTTAPQRVQFLKQAARSTLADFAAPNLQACLGTQLLTALLHSLQTRPPAHSVDKAASFTPNLCRTDPSPPVRCVCCCGQPNTTVWFPQELRDVSTEALMPGFSPIAIVVPRTPDHSLDKLALYRSYDIDLGFLANC